MSSAAAQLRVLLIADAGAQQLGAALTAAGHAVTTVHTVAAALEHSRTQSWDAAVIDVTAIEQTLDMVRRLRAAPTHIATIVLSADTSSATIRAGLDEGAFAWLVAPAPVELVEAAMLRAREHQLLHSQTPPGGPVIGVSVATAHNINNQLGGIMGLAQLHLVDDDLPEELRDDLLLILQSARTIADLLKQLRQQQPEL